MRDDQLLEDLASKPYAQEIVETLKKNNITTYSQLFMTLKDGRTDPKIIYDGCYALFYVSDQIDKRRAVPPLLTALKSNDADARGAAALALGQLNSSRAVLPLIDLLSDNAQPMMVRHRAIDALSSFTDESVLSLFWKIIDDPNEHVELRSRAIEMMYEEHELIDRFIALLADLTPDIRFWAAYRLGQTSENISRAIVELDHTVAHDHTLPIAWGWHVDREAMLPLETIYYNLIVGISSDEAAEYYGRAGMYLISPAPEYSTLDWRYRKWLEDWTYTTEPLPEIELRIDPEWLAKKLKAKWPEIRRNIREPRPQAYLLDWHLQVGEEHLIGALHRDQYAVVLTGGKDMILAFAAWYRGLFPESQHLYFYEWADAHVELKPNMSAAEIQKAHSRTSISAVEVKAEDLTFG